MLGLVLVSACGNGDSNADARPPSDAPVDAVSIDGHWSDGGTALIPATLPDPLPSGAIDLTAVTFNAGLLSVVKGPEERMPLIITALKALDADVLCLEEIYTQFTNPPAFAAQLTDTYPYAYWTWTGVQVNLNGLLIVSKHPLYRGRELYYSNGADHPVDRMAIGATMVDSEDAWHVNLLCTHLHAGLKAADISKKEVQATELNAWASDEGYLDGPSLLLGDFNAGPVPPSADACECEDVAESCEPLCDDPDMTTYNKVLEAWTDPWPTTADFYTQGHAQFIDMSEVPALYPNEPTQRIDHCFYTGLGTSAFQDGETVLDEPQEITVGEETIHYLSDHNGVRCTFAPPE